MPRTPSNAELRQMILDLCRASVLLRIAEQRGIISGCESGRLADGVDTWLAACESQITPILERPDAPPESNVVDFVGKRGVSFVPPEPRSEAMAAAPVPRRSPSVEHLAELRRQLQSISQAIPKV